MKWTSLNDLRSKYLEFFESKGHLSRRSYSLVPESDRSLLLIVAGMAPLKKYFTGEAEPPCHRMATCQKCIRTNDIEHVGYTARHGTFFEMLGNFSFGDYFKEEALQWAWEFLTVTLEIPADLLWPSVYEEDEEAYDIWKNKIGVREDHIVKLGKADNFWEHGSGPCGPCSEIYFDRGEKYGCGSADCRPGCDCDRYMEIWNNVFSQFNNDGKGNYTELATKNIDTGMGLERLACVMQGVDNMFEVDTVRNIISAVSERAGVSYKDNEKSDVSLRIIADHARASAFLIADGVMPSNEGRGYVLRRLMRRACRHGRILGITDPFLFDVMNVVARENEPAYPELTEKLDYIRKIVRMEEDRFGATVESGMNLLESLINSAKAENKSVLDGADVFKLSDTYGFPLDLTREIAEENGLGIDEKGFEENLAAQKQRARAARGNISGWDDSMNSLADGFAKTEFCGYNDFSVSGKIIGIIDTDTDELCDSASANAESEPSRAVIITDTTVFYGEGGGEIGDTGVIFGDSGKAVVVDTKKKDGVYMHVCNIKEGSLSVGDTVTLSLDAERRKAISRNHSAVHLLDAALRAVLGNHIQQAGSYVSDKTARFDFTHYAAVTAEELKKVERLVNEKIFEGIDVDTFETDIETAKSSGAIALFGEKYGSTVRVVKMGDFSAELCGGAHVSNTGKIGVFRIISEASVASGVRRIEAVTGFGVLELLYEREKLIANTAKEMKAANIYEIDKRAAQITSELKSSQQEIERLNSKLADSAIDEIVAKAERISSFKLVSGITNGLSLQAVRSVADKMKGEDDTVFVVSCTFEGRSNFVASAGKNAVKAGVHVGNLLKELSSIVGGGGGGRPDSATSGVQNTEKIPDAIEYVKKYLENK